MIRNKKLEDIIHTVFVKYDLIWVIKKWFPEDEYQMEEAKLYVYIENKINIISISLINNKLIKIMEDWFWESPLDIKTLKILKKMAEEIYDWLNN